MTTPKHKTNAKLKPLNQVKASLSVEGGEEPLWVGSEKKPGAAGSQSSLQVFQLAEGSPVGPRIPRGGSL